MHETYSLTEAKAKFSEIINRVHFRKERFAITKKGKAVAIVVPFNDINGVDSNDGLIQAKGVLSDLELDVEEMVETIYAAREAETDREVNL